MSSRHNDTTPLRTTKGGYTAGGKGIPFTTHSPFGKNSEIIYPVLSTVVGDLRRNNKNPQGSLQSLSDIPVILKLLQTPWFY